ncbi:unnamed protein product [Caenorhabditis bovis]|uniref:Uncharacterized protein n=1 Tax=Caenorhabditis bovis TaxID=2654633 RepID=A0A8S1ENU9_9PELO|nr:unnamed protein product [Caenorhabditis bovis]
MDDQIIISPYRLAVSAFFISTAYLVCSILCVFLTAFKVYHYFMIRKFSFSEIKTTVSFVGVSLDDIPKRRIYAATDSKIEVLGGKGNTETNVEVGSGTGTSAERF